MLLPAYCEIGDLGPPLGWSVLRKDGRRKSRKLVVRNVELPGRPPIQAGSMVALAVATEQRESLPFAVARIVKVDDESIVVQWYGKLSKQTMEKGVWRAGYFSSSRDEYYYSDRRSHYAHVPYTSVISKTRLTVDHILGHPFELTADQRVPMSVLREISQSGDICNVSRLR